MGNRPSLRGSGATGAASSAHPRPTGPADLVLKNCRLVNVLSGEIYPADIEISGERIRRTTEAGRGRGRKTLEAEGAFAVPGLMDAHLHTEASLLTLSRFAEAVLPGGTTSFFVNPHEIANVLGLRGVKWMLKDAGRLPIRLFVIAPCKVPTAPRLETSGVQPRGLRRIFHTRHIPYTDSRENVEVSVYLGDFIAVARSIFSFENRIHSRNELSSRSFHFQDSGAIAITSASHSSAGYLHRKGNCRKRMHSTRSKT